MTDALLLLQIKFQQFAARPFNNCADHNSADCDTTLPEVRADEGFVTRGLQLLFGVLGAMAVLYIIIGGFQYVSSQGNPQEVEKARNTIMYAVIGLVIAILAQAIIAVTLGVL